MHVWEEHRQNVHTCRSTTDNLWTLSTSTSNNQYICVLNVTSLSTRYRSGSRSLSWDDVVLSQLDRVPTGNCPNSMPFDTFRVQVCRI